MKKTLFFSFLALVLTGLIVGVVSMCRVGEGKPVSTGAEKYRYEALDILIAHLARMEKPDARSVYLADSAAEIYRPFFERAGLACATNGAPGQFKLVFLGGEGPHDWRALTKKVASGGAMAWALDVRGMTALEFYNALTDFPCAATRLWMPGEQNWLLTGRLVPCQLKLDVMLNSFLPEGAIADLARASCSSYPELLASYVGMREEILPAFQGDPNTPVRAEFFIPCEIPKMDWLIQGDVDDDIWDVVCREIRSLQVVRRVIAEGNLLSSQSGKIDTAIDKWATAALRNPHDIMLLDRLHRLAVNAHAFEKIGNLKGAAKCYETMISIRPKDVAAMERYAACMRRLGYTEIADAAAKRVKELLK